MSLPITDTYAGTDSDGKIWGIEGTNLMIILFGTIISLAVFLLAWSRSEQFGFLAYAIGLLPATVAILYVLCLRQGKPKAFDTDLMETLITGRGWMSAAIRKDNLRGQ